MGQYNPVVAHHERLARLHAARVAEGVAARRPGALRRLLNLELAFHLWRAYFHRIASTSFGYFLLEEAVAALEEGPLAHPSTARRRAEFWPDPTRYDPEGGELWVLEGEVGLGPVASSAALAFRAELAEVEAHARRVAAALRGGDRGAWERLGHLEAAAHLSSRHDPLLRSPSFRLAHYLRVRRRLGRGRWRFDLQAYLLEHPYPGPHDPR
ncbi:hypothetical protein Mterra_02277 [Calidithermus terrae]|uniref:Uncharacterized protein n=1 Tax=Calidithermus terrae TaxID=1408545 RepID=A0A399EMS4_9DEIN|nr:hypothetical protein Mterra_02277 [Calidithermus terrae]